MTTTVDAPATRQSTDADLEILRETPVCFRQVTSELGKRIFGQEEVIRDLFVALAVHGHALMIGVPGLAKTSAGAQPGGDSRSAVPAHPVHPRPHARRHHRHRNHRGSRGRAAAVPVRARSALSPA